MADITLENPEEQVHWLLTRRGVSVAALMAAMVSVGGGGGRRAPGSAPVQLRVGGGLEIGVRLGATAGPPCQSSRSIQSCGSGGHD